MSHQNVSAVHANGVSERLGERLGLHASSLGEMPLFFMEAHSGISAKIASTAGFDALWASGFSISTMLGLRDCNEASWSTILSVVEHIVDASSIPVIVDADSGHGNFNTARRFLEKAERLGAAGICIEDKEFPKLNSFVDGDHSLATVEEFTGKIRACRDARRDPAFCLIARTESLIAGLSVEHALLRAEEYADAGADAIFIHSREQSFDQISLFAEMWSDKAPLVIAPTTYSSTPTSAFSNAGIGGVVWANQSMRASVAAMQNICDEIQVSRAVHTVDTKMASIDSVFSLLAYADLLTDEEAYFPSRKQPAAGLH